MRGRGWIVGPLGAFVIEPTSEAISVPASHTSGSVALDFLSTHRSPSLFVAVAQQNTAGPGTSLKDLHILARGCHGTWLPRVTGPRQDSIL